MGVIAFVKGVGCVSTVDLMLPRLGVTSKPAKCSAWEYEDRLDY